MPEFGSTIASMKQKTKHKGFDYQDQQITNTKRQMREQKTWNTATEAIAPSTQASKTSAATSAGGRHLRPAPPPVPPKSTTIWPPRNRYGAHIRALRWSSRSSDAMAKFNEDEEIGKDAKPSQPVEMNSLLFNTKHPHHEGVILAVDLTLRSVV